jgi:GT2 family glycosyltransferase
MHSPLTVLIPTYNPGKHLDYLLEAIARGVSGSDLAVRIELSDDCSLQAQATDQASFRVLAPTVEVRIHRNVVNLGEGANVNAAMRRLEATGHEWVILMHQDDLVCAEWLRYCHRYVRTWTFGQPEMLFTGNKGIYSLDELPSHWWNTALAADPAFLDIPPDRPGLDYVSEHWAWIPSGTLFRTAAYNSMHGFHPTIRYAGDNDFMVRWLLSGRGVRQVNHSWIYKLVHKGSSSSRCVLDGTDSEGSCYLMIRYAAYRTCSANHRAHLAWLYRDFRTLISGLKKLDAQLVRSRARAVTIALRSWLAIHIPGFCGLLPSSVRQLLRAGPPLLNEP